MTKALLDEAARLAITFLAKQLAVRVAVITALDGKDDSANIREALLMACGRYRDRTGQDGIELAHRTISLTSTKAFAGHVLEPLRKAVAMSDSIGKITS